MSRDRVLIGAAIVLVAGALVVFFAWNRSNGRSTAGEPAIEARAVLAPEVVLFGDTVNALVEVTLDRNRVDPDSIRVQVDFAPWAPIARAERSRLDGKTTTYIRQTFALRCLVASCISTAERTVQDFPQARVAYSARGDEASSKPSSLEVPWPELVIGSRYSSSGGPRASRWRADLLSLPAVSYRLRPGLLLALLLVVATGLAVAGAAFVYLALPRRAPPAEPAADEPAEPELTPLERALALIEDPARVDGAADQRRALEFLAGGLVQRGDTQLAQAARALAWSEPVPVVERTSGLAAQVRSALGEEWHALPE